MQKIIHHSREIRVIQIRSIRLGHFTAKVEFYMQVYLRDINGAEQKL